MQTNKTLSLVGCFIFLLLTACSPEDDIKNPNFNPLIFAEDFSKGAIDDTVINLENWTNVAEIGTVKWKTQIRSSNPFAEFSSFLPNVSVEKQEPVHVGWLISPAINMDMVVGEILQFRAAQRFVVSSGNSLEVLVSTDYNGTNLSTANWQPIEANLPTTSSSPGVFINSGEIDLSAYTGNINIAFKVVGSGTNSSLRGTYQVDAIRIYTKN